MYKLYVMTLLVVSMMTANAVNFQLNIDTWLNDSSLYGGKATFSLNGETSRTTYAGQMRASFDGPVYEGYSQSFLTYCMDVNNTLAGGYFEPLLWEQSVPGNQNPVWTGDPLMAQSLYLTYRDQVTNDSEAVALQLAIWNSLYDNDNSLLGGTFKVSKATGDAITIANLWMNDENLVPASVGTWWQPVNQDGSYRSAQSLMGDAVSVPEPGTTVASLLAGLGFLAFARRKLVS